MSTPYFRLYPTDFEAKTSHLTLAEDGAYNRLLRLCWMTPGCSLPDDDDWIMRRVRAHSDEDKATVRAVLSEFFQRKNHRVFNKRLTEESEHVSARVKAAAENGSKGGRPRKALKTQQEEQSDGFSDEKPEKANQNQNHIIDTSPNGDVSVSHANDTAAAVSAYNRAADAAGWPKVQRMTPVRSKALRARLAECGGVEGWEVALRRAQESDFLCGRTAKPWSGFGFDWLTKSANFTKLMEGNYDNRTGAHHASPGDATLRAIAAAAGAF